MAATNKRTKKSKKSEEKVFVTDLLHPERFDVVEISGTNPEKIVGSATNQSGVYALRDQLQAELDAKEVPPAVKRFAVRF